MAAAHLELGPRNITHTLQECHLALLQAQCSVMGATHGGGGLVLVSPPTLLPLSSRHAGQEALLSPGGGVSVEVGLCLRHKSSSSLLRRMPVPGEYTMAPKLQTGNVEPELDALALNNPGASTPKPCNTHGPQRSPLPVPPQDLAHGPPSNSFPQQGKALVPDK